MNSNVVLEKKTYAWRWAKTSTDQSWLRKGPVNDCKYMKIIYMWTTVEEMIMKAILAAMNTT